MKKYKIVNKGDSNANKGVKIEESPRMLQRNPNFNKLIIWSKELAKIYHSGIYLVGSALNPDNQKPRDWDIRCKLNIDPFCELFGNPWKWLTEIESGNWTKIAHNWSRHCVKVTKWGWQATGLNIDFQLYPFCYWRKFRGLPKLCISRMTINVQAK